MAPALSPEFTTEFPVTLLGAENLVSNGCQIIPSAQILVKSEQDFAPEDEGIGLDQSEETTSGCLFGPLPELPSDSVDAGKHWRSGAVENIDTNFATAIKEERANGRNSASSGARQYDLRPRASRDDSGFGSASEEPSIKNEFIDSASSPGPSSSHSKRTRKPRVSWNGTHDEIPFSQRLATILPMNTRDRLREKPGKCVATTKKATRCKRNAKHSQEVRSRVPRTFSESTIDSALKPSLEPVRDLIESALCGQHREKAVAEFEIIIRTHLNGMSKDDSAVFDNWVKALALEPRSTSEYSASQSADSDALALKSEATDTTQDKSTRPRAASAERVLYSGTLTRQKKKELIGVESIAVSQPPVRVLRSVSKPYIQNLVLYQPDNQRRLTVSQALDQLMHKALSKKELDTGFIYIYWCPPNFGQIKIGYTVATTPEKRKHGWAVKCRHPVADVSPDPDLLKPVRHAYRVERLIHAELKEVRLWEPCCRGCSGSHKEWFRETVRHAERVFEKWAAWMEEMPYVEGEEKPGWALRKDISKERIQELCKPVERLVLRERHSLCDIKSSKSAWSLKKTTTAKW